MVFKLETISKFTEYAYRQLLFKDNKHRKTEGGLSKSKTFK